MPLEYNHDHDHEITLFAETNFRNAKRRFGIKTDDRRRHMYLLGKTGMGKTTLMENLIMSDIYAGHGCCYIDPHGDTAEKLVDYIPAHRVNDVVYFNPADVDFPLGFNILETDNDQQKPLVASGLMGVFKKIWPDVWSARMEYILMNCVLALLDYPGATLLGINRLLVDKEYRTRVIAKIRDPIVKTFWVAEFSSWSEKYATEAIAPVQNKVGQFLSSSVIRNIVAQVKSTMDIRRIMDDGKILIVNLSKGRIGEDNMRLLGGMLITKIQLAAQERQNIPEHERRDFYAYVDEFQNFANESFAAILSEARKYRLNLIVAHQYIEQLDEKVAPAVFGNVGTLIIMRVGGADAEFLETEFTPTFLPEDLVNLAKFQFYTKLMVDGVATPPFSANSLAPIAQHTGNGSKVIKVSRERYAEPRPSIEEKVLQWSGMELAGPNGTTGETGLLQAMTETTVPPSKLPYAQPVDPSDPQASPDAVASSDLNALPSNIHYPTIKSEEELADERERINDRKVNSNPLEQIGEDHATEYLTIKPERLAAIAASAPQPMKKDKPKFPHTCTRCGKVWNLPMQLDPTRPMYCAECRPIVLEERKQHGSQVRQVKRTAPPPESASAPVFGDAPFAEKAESAYEVPNRPRIVNVSIPAPASAPATRPAPARATLLDEVLSHKGLTVEMDKQELERRAGSGGDLMSGAGAAARTKRRRRRGGSGDRGSDSSRTGSGSTPSSQYPSRPQTPSSQHPSHPQTPSAPSFAPDHLQLD